MPRRQSAEAGAPRPIKHLPEPSSAIVGRQREVREAQLLLRTCSLITLVGPPGVGKTRLALAVAEDLASDFQQGVFFVDLSAIQSTELTLPAICQGLGVRLRGRRSAAQSLREHLTGKRVLIVLDNFEHLAKAAQDVADLLPSSRGLRILVTSRSALNVATERELPVPPLEVPDLPAALTPETIATCASVALFVQRAQAVNPDFGLTTHNARAVAEICVRLEGLPLAIELAAAQARAMQTPAILERLDRQLGLLVGGAEDLPPRHQALRAAIAWSYDPLDGRERLLFHRLATFGGGCAIEAAQVVCAGDGLTPDEIPGILESLKRRSLLTSERRGESGLRYRFLESIREYAFERLTASGEADRAQRAHAAHFLGIAEQANAHLAGPEQPHWLEVLRTEQHNLRAALRWSIETSEAEGGLRLAAALFRFWEMSASYSEGRRWLDQVLTIASPPSVPRARALTVAGALVELQGDFAAARSHVEAGLAIYRELGNRQGICRSLSMLGVIALDCGDHDAARTLLEESLTIARDMEDNVGVARALTNLGILERDVGDFERARLLLEENLALRQGLGEPRQVAIALNNLGYVLRMVQGDRARARAVLEGALAEFRALHDERGVSHALAGLGCLALDEGDHAAARAHLTQCLSIRRDLDYVLRYAECLDALAQLAAARREAERAVRLFGAADALREALGQRLPPADRPLHDRWLANARSRLDEATFAVAWAQGRAMSAEHAVGYALGGERAGQPERLAVRLFGEFEVRRGGVPIAPQAWQRRRHRLLFAYLLTAGDPVPRDALCAALWPDLSPASAGASLRTALHHVRRALEPDLQEGAPSAYLAVEHGRYGVHWEAVSTDVQEFDGMMALAARASSPLDRIRYLELAVALYRADLLTEFTNESWALVERERLRLAYLSAMDQLAQVRFEQGRSEEGLETLRAILRLDPWREETHRALMRALALAGRRSEALHAYRECEALLRKELSVSPSPETTALFAAIESGRPL